MPSTGTVSAQSCFTSSFKSFCLNSMNVMKREQSGHRSGSAVAFHFFFSFQFFLFGGTLRNGQSIGTSFPSSECLYCDSAILPTLSTRKTQFILLPMTTSMLRFSSCPHLYTLQGKFSISVVSVVGTQSLFFAIPAFGP